MTALPFAQEVIAEEIELAKLPHDFCALQAGAAIKQTSQTGQFILDSEGNAYRAEYESTGWSGTVKKYKAVQHDANHTGISEQISWDAAVNLSKNPQQRKIFTYNTSTSSVVPFKFTELPADIQDLFNRSPESGRRDNLGVERVNFLYGDRTLEGLSSPQQTVQFKKRKTILGDIVNSIPVYVGAAAKNIIDQQYSAFFNQYKNRPGTVYVNANDGMLHAFSTQSGNELFAFIPSFLLDKIPALCDRTSLYDTYLDGKIQVSEAQAFGKWRTVLVSGLGGGGSGVFALDVTTPDIFPGDQGLLFEFSAADDADMGQVTSAPVIAKLSTGKNADGSSRYQYYVLVSSGYNVSNAQGADFLFLLSLDKPANTGWKLNQNYYKIKAGLSGNVRAHALATPGLVLNLQGEAILAYAGDIQGNIWRFDFSGSGPAAIRSAVKIFNTSDETGRPQPVTVQPAIQFAPGGGYLVLFGTGKYVEKLDADPTNFTTESFYAIHDRFNEINSTNRVNSRNDLAARHFIGNADAGKIAYKSSGADFTYGDDTTSTKKGWFIDLPDSKTNGARVISEAATEFGNVFFNAFTPDRTCQTVGSSNSYKLDLLSGKTVGDGSLTGFKSKGLLLGKPLVFPGALELGNRNSFGQRNGAQYFSVFNFNSGSEATSSTSVTYDKAEIRSGRLSWRELPVPVPEIIPGR